MADNPTKRVRKKSKTDRGNLHTQIIPDKKKKQSKEKCKEKIREEE